MSNGIVRHTLLILAGLAYLILTSACGGAPQRQEPSNPIGRDQPEARALYNKMIGSIRKAETLSYESNLREEVDGDKWDPWTYRVWMKKPNFFRVETVTKDGTKHAILVGDGGHAWSYFPNGRPWFSGEDRGAYEKSRSDVYVKEPAPPGKYSIGYSIALKKSNCFPILNPSVFQGINDTLEPLIDSIRSLGAEKVGGEDCDVIEISHMNNQRSYYFWISRRDNLPRKLKDVVRTKGEHITLEVWSRVTLNGQIPMEQFKWTPPKNWNQWHPPAPEDRLVKPGRQAPDFELLSAEETTIKLSDYRDNVVWLIFWRVGCPPCREEIPYLEKLYGKYKSKGLIVLGFDFADDKRIALDFLRRHSVTFPNVVDDSQEAIKTGFFSYGARAAPVNYIVDREGKIAAAWLGYDHNSTQGIDVLAKLGLE